MFPVLTFAQLTNADKKYGEILIIYYSGNVPGVPADKTKVDAYIYGNDTAKVAVTKTFVIDILLPVKRVNVQQLSNTVTNLEAEVTALEDYIK